MQTPKKFSSFSDQVSWISDEKGIKINDREYAEEMLRQIGYFPLMGGYKHLFRISNTKKYKAGTSFEEIVSLYKFDAELRELFFKYLLQVERQMRSLMSYYFTEMYGAEQKQYLDANNYNHTKRNHATIVKLIATLKRATTTTDYTYINYYRKTYGEIPLWVLANVLTFGNLSKMFRVFPQSLKSKVSKNFEPLNQHQMEQFLSVLTKYRNVCAHGERLFTYRTVDAIADTPLHKKLSLPQSGNQYEKGKLEKYYQIPFKVKKNPLRDSEIPIVLEDFLLKNFNIQEFVFSFLTLKLRFLVGLSTDVREVSALVCGHGRLRQSLQ